jgi:hypothetical protein
MRRFPLTVWVYAIVIALVCLTPYFVAQVSTPDGWEYSGALPVPDGVKVDYYSHMAQMWQGSAFDFDNNILFTHEKHAGLPTVQNFYFVLGAIAQITGLSFSTMYHVAQFILTILMILAIWTFASRYLKTIGERWVAMFFATIVFGWSWILFFVVPDMTLLPGLTPIELWLSDAYNLLGVMVLPHFPTAVILQIIAFLTFDSWLQHPQRRYIVLLTIVLLLDAIIQPHVVLMTFLVFGIMTAYFLFFKRTIGFMHVFWLIPPALAHGGIAVMQYLMIMNDPVWATYASQNQTLSPPPIYYVLGFMPLLIPIFLGWRHIVEAIKKDNRWLLPLVWVLVVVVLLYAPFPTQRRYLLGVQTPLAVLAGLGWYKVVMVRITESWRPFANIPYITAGSLGFLMILVVNVVGLSNPRTIKGSFYLPDEVSASMWIKENTTIDSLILTTFDWDTSGSGGKVVSMTGRRVYIGHWIETKDFDYKRNQLAKFYNPETPDGWRQMFLSSVGVDVIWYDDDVANFGDWLPSDAEFLSLAVETDTVQLYTILDTE